MSVFVKTACKSSPFSSLHLDPRCCLFGADNNWLWGLLCPPMPCARPRPQPFALGVFPVVQPSGNPFALRYYVSCGGCVRGQYLFLGRAFLRGSGQALAFQTGEPLRRTT